VLIPLFPPLFLSEFIHTLQSLLLLVDSLRVSTVTGPVRCTRLSCVAWVIPIGDRRRRRSVPILTRRRIHILHPLFIRIGRRRRRRNSITPTLKPFLSVFLIPIRSVVLLLLITMVMMMVMVRHDVDLAKIYYPALLQKSSFCMTTQDQL
jgi:hypothetical protein